MRLFKLGQSRKVGLPPGTLVQATAETVPSVVESIIYGPDRCEVTELTDLDSQFKLGGRGTVTWLRIRGLGDIDLIGAVGRRLDIHPLSLEDIVNTDHRPKVEDLADYILITLRLIKPEDEGKVSNYQLSLVIGPGFLVSFEETADDFFRPVLDRLKRSSGRIRQRGADYIAYALMDTVIDNYYVALEQAGFRVEDLEDRIADGQTDRETLADIYDVKRQLIMLQRAVGPLREIIVGLDKSESDLVDKATAPFLRDLYDHIIGAHDMIEAYRDILSDLLATYHTLVSNRMNQVMQVLTIIATIFIPLTFVAGIYGMNFEKMPELKWAWGYPAALALMAVIAGVMLVYFKRKDWL